MKNIITILLLFISIAGFAQADLNGRIARRQIYPADTTSESINKAQWQAYIESLAQGAVDLTNYYTKTETNALPVSTFTNDAGYLTSYQWTNGAIGGANDIMPIGNKGIEIYESQPTMRWVDSDNDYYMQVFGVDGELVFTSVSPAVMPSSLTINDDGITPLKIYDENTSAGTTNQVLSKSATGLDWIDQSSGVTDHSLLSNLDYASSGHTGFAGTGVANTFASSQTFSSNITVNGNMYGAPIWYGDLILGTGGAKVGFVQGSTPSTPTSSVGYLWMSSTDKKLYFKNNTTTYDLTAAGSGGGDMYKSTYDPASINEQLVGLTASQSLTNKSVNGVTLDATGSTSVFLNKAGTYTAPTATGTNLSFTGTSTNAILNSGTGGSTVTFTAGTNITFSPATSGGITINSTGGSGVSLGAATQIPFMNAGATDFSYSSNLVWNGSVFGLGGGIVATGFTQSAGGFGVDVSTYVDKDGSNNMTFTDAVTGTKTLAQLAASGSGTVTSVSAGNGMDFTTITSSGSVTMGTPSTITSSTTNSVTSTSHTHAITGVPLLAADNAWSGYNTIAKSRAGSALYVNNSSSLGTGIIAQGGNIGLHADGVNYDVLLNGSGTFRISTFATPPATASSAGVAGTVLVTADYIYVCTATNTWKRTQLTTW